MSTTAKIILIIFLIGCLFNMPYGYYQIVYWVVTAGCCYLAYDAYNSKLKPLTVVYAVAAIVFNPLIKFTFHREQWQVVDKIAIGFLSLLLILDLVIFLRSRRLN